jgi:carbonic anhydrase
MAGQQQSPINLRNARFAPTLHTDLVINWQPGDQELVPKRKEHGYRFVPVAEQTICLDGDTYTLSDVHFHRPSEHWVDGHRREAEMHAVHHRVDDGIRRCVIAVFLVLGADHDDPGTTPTSVDLTALLPEHRAFYRYEGSLTTPAYDEIVSWVVLDQKVVVDDPDLRAFVRHHADEARDPQPLHRRFVLTDDVLLGSSQPGPHMA